MNGHETGRPQSPTVPPLVSAVGLRCLAVAGAVLLFAAAMTRPVTYDEDQYIAAGVFAMDMLPFRDFAYLQAPLYPFVLAGAFRLSGGYYLLTGRLLTFGLAVVSAVLLWRLLRRLGAGPGLAAVLMAACLASPFLAAPLSNTRNDALPLTLMLAALSVHLWAADRSWWGRAGAALLFGLAVEAKISYLFGPVALGVHALFAPRQRVPPFVLGMAAAAAPAVLCCLAAPEAFRFGVYGYHVAAPADWYGREGQAALLTPAARLSALLDWSLLGGNLALLVLAAALSLAALARRTPWRRPGPLLLGMLLGALALALVPSPSWAMYYAATAPLLACCIAHLHRAGGAPANERRRRILVAVASLPILPVLLLNVPDLVLLADPARWVGIEAHRTATEIRAALPDGGEVATLFPRAVMDANPVRREFATGPFVFRSGDLWPPDTLARLHALSPATLDAAFDRAPPAAIYAGLNLKAWKVPMDQALTRYAEARGWRVVRTDAEGGRLWLPPRVRPALPP